jgi:hypothetical protein
MTLVKSSGSNGSGARVVNHRSASAKAKNGLNTFATPLLIFGICADFRGNNLVAPYPTNGKSGGGVPISRFDPLVNVSVMGSGLPTR